MDGLTEFDIGFLPDTPESVYLVGGSVRDLLAGRIPADIDLVVAGDIARMARHIAARTGGSIVDLGAKGFDVLRVASPETTIDITPLVQTTIEDDLLQRDFTINAMAWDVRSRRLIDCTGGLADMQQHTIRLVSPAALEKDPARLVRAYRMAAVFDFSIETETRTAIDRHRHLVSGVAGERVWAELTKIFSASHSARVIGEMAADRLLTAIFPELAPTAGCTQNRHHDFDVFDHSLRAYEHLEDLLADVGARFPDLAAIAGRRSLDTHAAILKYACLLHDVGKPATRQIDSKGNVRFYGHAAKGANITLHISRRLHLSNNQRDVADAIIRHHLRPLFLFIASEKGSLSKKGMIRFFNHCGPLTLPVIVHTMADIMAKRRTLQGRDAGFIAFCSRLLQAYTETARRDAAVPPLINGHDLISVLGLSPSPRFKILLDRVNERRLSGELSTRDQALEWVRRHLNQ